MNLKSIIEKDYKNTCQLIVVSKGKLVYEYYGNQCNVNNKIHVYSVTKSIVSLLIGIAIDKGYIQDENQKISDYYPVNNDFIIKDLLTMNVHYKYFMPPYIKYFTSSNYSEFAINLMHPTKTGFNYAPLIGPDILCGILVKATHMNVLDFAKKYLFEPLDIHIENRITFKDKEEQMKFNNSIEYNGWVEDPSGISTCGWGLTCSASDLIKIGNMMLDENQTIVSRKWIEKCTSHQNTWKKRNLKYGYLFWVDDDGFSAMGDGGNILYVNKNKQYIVAMTCLLEKNTKDRIDFIKKYIETSFESSM